MLKTNFAKNSLIDKTTCERHLKTLVKQFSKDRKCKLYLLHGDMTDEEIHSLYINEKLNAFVSLPHGEGFGLPIFEAAYSGMPVVTVGWSGQCDYLYDSDGKEKFYNVSFDINHIQKDAVWDGVLQKDSMWAFPRENSAKEQMRKCYEDVLNKTTTACEYSVDLRERFSPENLYQQFVDSILSTEGINTSNEQSKVVVL